MNGCGKAWEIEDFDWLICTDQHPCPSCVAALEDELDRTNDGFRRAAEIDKGIADGKISALTDALATAGWGVLGMYSDGEALAVEEGEK